MAFFENQGFCPICSCDTTFVADDAWFRDHYLCTRCRSIPRERALMQTVEMFYPNWRDLAIHESSPNSRGASARFARECRQYQPSHFFPDTPLGAFKNGVRCENLESLTYADESIDLHITQDVIEHVFDAPKVFREIARTLKPGGAHIFTVPLVNKAKPTVTRARLGVDKQIVHIEPPIYHGNPISDQGSLVIRDWGFDICGQIFEACGLFTQTIYIDDISKGIRAECIEVLATFKPPRAARSTRFKFGAILGGRASDRAGGS